MKKIFITILITFNLSVYGEEFNNFCATSLSEGNFQATDCSVSEVVGGKTYCFGNQSGLEIFLENPQEVIQKAEVFFSTTFTHLGSLAIFSPNM